MISDEILDAIAGIEMHRQHSEKEAGRAAASSEALRKLRELLERETQALQSHGPGARHEMNIEALTAGIERVKRMADGAGASAMPQRGRPRPQNAAARGEAHHRSRSKGRRTMGRGSGR